MTTAEAAYLEVVEQYMHGYCMFLAAALHHRYGFRIGLVSVLHSGRGDPNTERLSHAWVTTPDGKCLDIQGLQSLREMTAFMEDAPDSYVLHREVSLEFLEKLAGAKLPPDEIDVQRALAVAQQYLADELRKWES